MTYRARVVAAAIATSRASLRIHVGKTSAIRTRLEFARSTLVVAASIPTRCAGLCVLQRCVPVAETAVSPLTRDSACVAVRTAVLAGNAVSVWKKKKSNSTKNHYIINKLNLIISPVCKSPGQSGDGEVIAFQAARRRLGAVWETRPIADRFIIKQR